MSDYPEHVKLQIAKPHADIISEFLEWLFDRRFHIGLFRDEECWECGSSCIPDRRGIELWLSEYFDIDLHTLDLEKRAMINEIREADKAREAG